MTTEELLAPLRPDECALVPLFQAHFDEGMLREIAEADYGWKADECFAILQPMLREGLRAPADSNLQEVLELIRWSEPADPAHRPGGQLTRGHWMRLFACTALVRAAQNSPHSSPSECDTLAHLAASAIELGPAVARAAASVLAWRFVTYSGSESDSAFLSFAILLLAAHLDSREASGQWLNDLAAWVEDEEARVRKTQSKWPPYTDHWNMWLFGLTNYSQREAVWRSLALSILARPERPHPSVARERLQLLGELVAGI